MNWKGSIEAFIYYLKLERGYSVNTQKGYHSDISLFAEFMMNQKIFEPSRTTESDIQKFLQDYYQLHQASSQARILAGIKAFFAFLIVERRIKVNPAKNIESPKLGFKIPNYLEYFEVKKIIDSISLKNFYCIRDKAIIETLYACGIRASECCNLKISNIDFKNETIKVIGKGNKERIIPIAQSALNTLQIYLHTRIKYPLQLKQENFVFLSNQGFRLNKSLLHEIIQKAARSARISKKISAHTFRHTFATHLIQNGMDILVLKELLGHESIITTQIYTHTDIKYLRKTIDECHPMNLK